MGFVIIGRNEGPRLRECLASVQNQSELTVYVDSGSIDGSADLARQAGAEVVELTADVPFSAARARNEGFTRMRECNANLQYVHFIDGDCVLKADWPFEALAALESRADVVAVCGRRRERFPEASIYNRICDVEWRIAPAGGALVFGGDVAMRIDALLQAGGYHPGVIACEDEELALRLRQNGGRILQLDSTSSYHDAAIFRMSGWWLRAVRWGHGVAQVHSMHGDASEYHYAQTSCRTMVYGGAVPMTALGLSFATQGLSLALLVLFVLQYQRLVKETQRVGVAKDARLWSLSCVMAQPANLLGMALYHFRSKLAAGPSIIEYKRVEAKRALASEARIKSRD